MTQRFQLALNVDNIETAIEYYGSLFGVKPNKLEPGYANFAIENPPLKLVLFENPGAKEKLNHLGIESTEQHEVDAAIQRFQAAGIDKLQQESETCCYAVQNKIWSVDPSGTHWEWYRILEDTAEYGQDTPQLTTEQMRCC